MHGMQTGYDKLQKLQAVPSIFNFHYSAFEEEGVIHRDVEDRISQDQIFTITRALNRRIWIADVPI